MAWHLGFECLFCMWTPGPREREGHEGEDEGECCSLKNGQMCMKRASTETEEGVSGHQEWIGNLPQGTLLSSA